MSAANIKLKYIDLITESLPIDENVARAFKEEGNWKNGGLQQDATLDSEFSFADVR